MTARELINQGRNVDVDLDEGETLVIKGRNGNVIYEETESGHDKQAWETFKKLESIRNDVISAQNKLDSLLSPAEKANRETDIMKGDLKAKLNEKWASLIPDVGRKIAEFPSSSRPGLTHRVLVNPDDELMCTCEGFQYNRTCSHIDKVMATEPRHKLEY